jgi:flagellar basal body-associated protein FliL
MSERIILVIETIAIVCLAIMIVIYGQVLWQRFQAERAAVPDEVEVAEDEFVNDLVSDLSEADRMKILESLEAEASADAASVTQKDREAVLADLEQSEDEEGEGSIDHATRLEILKSLEGN